MSEPNRESGNPQIVLSLLSLIERDSATTQRKLAGDLGIALGLANAYLRRCVRKGLVKVRQVPLNRYAYYLTPQGFAEKSRLTAEYLAMSLDFFRRARRDCGALFEHCAARGWRKVALYGAGELAEIAVLSAVDTEVEVVCVIDSRESRRSCAGRIIVADLAAAQRLAGPAGLDGLVLTDTRSPQHSFEHLAGIAGCHGLAVARIAAPDLLGIAASAARPVEPASS
ncbi:MAG: winged helix-turn-helix transcriptional regulator [Alphaproteobacteria bacterium]|nr:winged helix-turn-helix transcriptional regulator [Alphaproteobacteria bacterium]MBV9860857.1 winged helix-turn-helix transcriptional regulator [Alphaproteobacteria bacterium]